ncbi:hypothetical protein PPL_05204 [Heterostelium album PN500]|uniref:Ankyrin repeat protein n=1 Tax=Heterostelium pallidum (strain ATCC 26659 / Pp 5 / PN500) TaxID=670386 RepID=D3B9Q8_HETP5|nr:hypothetical protein PPL_05204 [Heterostelium album PN500]EFA81970.1 hypothetical protein PPL_05204 [Heterostelium album PN500]|eukprot:XP_020434087.1 hypothetical protein PPL_05204 [Heterostelium album PN500]
MNKVYIGRILSSSVIRNLIFRDIKEINDTLDRNLNRYTWKDLGCFPTQLLKYNYIERYKGILTHLLNGGEANYKVVDYQLDFISLYIRSLETVAALGNLHLLQFLLPLLRPPIIERKIDLKIVLTKAIKHGHLSIVQFLHDQNIDNLFTPETMNFASSTGRLDIVKFLNENRSEGCTRDAMDSAAINGHLHIVKYLHFNRSEGCTTNAIDCVKDLDTLVFLHNNRSEGCTGLAIDFASRDGKFEVVQFLNENRSEGCSEDAINMAANYSHFDIVNYLLDHRQEGCNERALISTAKNGNLETLKKLRSKVNLFDGSQDILDRATSLAGNLPVVRYLHEHTLSGCSTAAMDVAVMYQNHDIVRFLHENRSEGCSKRAMIYAIQNNDMEMVRFLNENRTEAASTEMFKDTAITISYEMFEYLINQTNIPLPSHLVDRFAGNKSDQILSWLLSNKKEEFTSDAYLYAIKNNKTLSRVIWLKNNLPDLKFADCIIDFAATYGATLDIVQYLHENGGDSTKDAMDEASRLNHLSILEFLHNNRTEGCSGEAIAKAIKNGNISILKFIHNNLQDRAPDIYKQSLYYAYPERLKYIEIYNFYFGLVTKCSTKTTFDDIELSLFNQVEPKDQVSEVQEELTTFEKDQDHSTPSSRNQLIKKCLVRNMILRRTIKSYLPLIYLHSDPMLTERYSLDYKNVASMNKGKAHDVIIRYSESSSRLEVLVDSALVSTNDNVNLSKFIGLEII